MRFSVFTISISPSNNSFNLLSLSNSSVHSNKYCLSLNLKGKLKATAFTNSSASSKSIITSTSDDGNLYKDAFSKKICFKVLKRASVWILSPFLISSFSTLKQK